ncbi:translation initiation factor IF-2 [bacterium]|nr:translation initiation factor IF-2 [bacterium]
MSLLSDLNIRIKSPNQKLDAGLVQQVKDLYRGEDAQDDGIVPPKVIKVSGDRLLIKDLASLIDCDLGKLMKAVLEKGMLLNLNSEIDISLAVELAAKLNVVLDVEGVQSEAPMDIRSSLEKIEEAELDRDPDALTERPPVVTIMGHVDHGKTLLLDTIRKSNIISGEAGGITQHIGAYQVVAKGKKITFLDTPGHAAFTSLRARGSQITDVTILVVAADEGIKPQTVEAIHHAKAAAVPIIVAINKMDKPDADPERVKQQLVEHDLVPEEWGGKTIMVPISAKAKTGISELLDMILLVAEMAELRADSTCLAKAVVIESRLSRKKGPIATVLVKSGTLRVGDFFVIGTTSGKVRALLNDLGEKVDSAGPGAPVEVLGISEVPAPGSILECMVTERDTKEEMEQRLLAIEGQTGFKTITLEALSEQVEKGEAQRLNLIIKADVNGSLEAIITSVQQVHSPEVTVSIIHAATGPINENDILLARASSAIIVGFGITINGEAQLLAESEGVEIKMYSIIYQILDDLNRAVQGLLKPVFEEVEHGRAEVRQLFRFSKVGTIAGSYVLSGKIFRTSQVRVIRNKQVVHEGKLGSLKRFQEDVKEVATGFECGIVVEDWDVAVGDVIFCYTIQEKKR